MEKAINSVVDFLINVVAAVIVVGVLKAFIWLVGFENAIIAAIAITYLKHYDKKT